MTAVCVKADSILSLDGTPEHDSASSATGTSTCGAVVETERDGDLDGNTRTSSGGGEHIEDGADTVVDSTPPAPSTAGTKCCLDYTKEEEGVLYPFQLVNRRFVRRCLCYWLRWVDRTLDAALILLYCTWYEYQSWIWKFSIAVPVTTQYRRFRSPFSIPSEAVCSMLHCCELLL